MKPNTIGLRHVQVLVLFLLIFLAFGMRAALSVAIVAMTDPSTSSNPDVPAYPQWKDKSVILSAFFWGYPIPQILAGWLAGKYGSKWILIASMGTSATLCILVPVMAAGTGSYGVMANRAVQGLSQGFMFPAVHNAISHWVPAEERSRLGTIIYAAGPLGTVIGMVFTGAVSASNSGWPLIFYLYGVASLLWCIMSGLLSHSTPAMHPKIGEAERFYIENSLGQTDHKKIRKTPWKKMFTSLPVWAILVTHCGHNWGFWTLMTEIPSYMSHVMNFNMRSNSILSALPFLVLWILSFFMSFTADLLINKKILNLGHTRKLFNSIGLIIPAIALVFLGVTSADTPKKAVALLIVAVGFNSGVFCGFNVNHVDISPNYGGTLFGITNCFANITGIVAPLLVHFVVTDEADPTQWKIVFFVTAVIYVATNFFFVLFGSGDIQEWNKDVDDNGT